MTYANFTFSASVLSIVEQKHKETERDKVGQRETETEIERDRDRDRERQRETEWDRERQRQRQRDRERQIEPERNRERQRETVMLSIRFPATMDAGKYVVQGKDIPHKSKRAGIQLWFSLWTIHSFS